VKIFDQTTSFSQAPTMNACTCTSQERMYFPSFHSLFPCI